ncbi:MAG: reverse transcriptase-like protein [Candidatus Nomurabacteria bacterium]|nr:reverse transcriptase-like protein [Candidatus Nomurabacteria bacterium]
MKQKVIIRAVISHRGRILLIRRHGGRPSLAGLYELPGGSLHHHEQPVDALKRSLQIHVGLEPDAFRLRDVVSFIDPENRELQYVFITYEVSVLDGNSRVSLDDEYDHYVWKPLKNIQRNLVTNSTSILLNLGSEQNNSSDLILDSAKDDDKNTTIIIHSDGGSRGNPGPSAAAYIITDKDKKVIAEGGKFIGWSNNGIAEYVGVELALQKAVELNIKFIDFYSDSLMVINQINGLFSVKNREFRPIHDRIMQLIPQFRRITFRHVHREYNRLADGLVNKILDENETNS